MRTRSGSPDGMPPASKIASTGGRSALEWLLVTILGNQRQCWFFRSSWSWFGGLYRQNDFRASAAPDCGLQANRPAMRAHDAEYRGKPEAPSHKLGSEERIEDSGGNLRRYAATVVNHFEPDEVPRR